MYAVSLVLSVERGTRGRNNFTSWLTFLVISTGMDTLENVGTTGELVPRKRRAKSQVSFFSIEVDDFI